MFKWRGENYEIAKINWRNLKKIFSRTTGLISTNFGTQHPWVKKNQVCSSKRPRHFTRGDNYRIAKTHWRNLKTLFSRTTWPISTKLGTKHPWVKEIHDCESKGPRPFPREDNFKNAKIHWRNLKFFFSRTSKPIFTKLDTKHPCVKGFKFVHMEGYSLFQVKKIMK